MLIKKNKKNKNGFTLIELMVSIFLFSIVMVIAIGALMMIINASRKAKTIKTVVNNLNIAIEGMSREIRVGYNYTCNAYTSGEIQNSGDHDGNNCSSIGFHTKTGGTAVYKLEDGVIKRYLDESNSGGRNDDNFLAITADNITIDKLNFKIIGTNFSDSYQPRVMIRVTGFTTIEKFTTYFNIQTTVTQRKLAP